MRSGTRDFSRTGLIWGAIYAVAVTLLGGYAAFVSHADASLVALSAIGILIGSYPIYRGVRRGNLDVFEPPVLMVALTATQLFRPLYWLEVGEVFIDQYAIPSDRALAVCVRAATYLYLGQLVYFASYYSVHSSWRFEKLIPKFRNEWSKERSLLIVIIFTMAGLACFVGFSRSLGGIGNLVNQMHERATLTAGLGPWNSGIMLLPAASMIWFVTSVEQRRYLGWAVYTVCVLGLLSTMGGRSALLFPLLILLITFHYCRRRIRLFEAATLAAVVILFAVAFVTVRTQTYARRGLDVAVLGDQEWDSSHITEKYFRDQNYLDTFAVLIDDMPTSFPFQYGKTYVNLLAFPIPRKMWPEKPPAYEGALYSDVYFGGSGRPPGFAGVMYMNFHLLGVFIGFALLGQLHRSFYRYLAENQRSPACVCIYASLVVFLAEFTNVGLTQWIIHMPGVILAIWFCTYAMPRLREKSLYRTA